LTSSPRRTGAPTPRERSPPNHPRDRGARDGRFGSVSTTELWEVRRRYADREDYLAEIAQRTGRSILHELNDDELDDLVDRLRERLPTGPLVEQDRWTVWRGRRCAD
jgi:hypothetical protein